MGRGSKPCQVFSTGMKIVAELNSPLERPTHLRSESSMSVPHSSLSGPVNR